MVALLRCYYQKMFKFIILIDSGAFQQSILVPGYIAVLHSSFLLKKEKKPSW